MSRLLYCIFALLSMFACVQELDYQKKQPQQLGDKFVSVVSQFITVASFSFSDVEDSLSEAKELVSRRHCCGLFEPSGRHHSHLRTQRAKAAFPFPQHSCFYTLLWPHWSPLQESSQSEWSAPASCLWTADALLVRPLIVWATEGCVILCSIILSFEWILVGFGSSCKLNTIFSFYHTVKVGGDLWLFANKPGNAVCSTDSAN